MDLLIIVILTILMQPLIYGLNIEPLRIAVGLPFVSFFPGYVLVSALYPQRERLRGVERAALGVGLSLALVPLLGLVLNFTPWGISLTPIVATLSIWTLAIAAVAWLQRRRLASEERYDVPWASIVAWLRKSRRPADVALAFFLTLAIVGAISAVAWKVQQPMRGEPFTEFYVLGEQQMLQDYPTNLHVGEAQDYNLGVINREGQTATYTARAFLGDVEVGFLGLLTLDEGQTWEGKMGVTAVAEGVQQKLEFRLYRNSENEVYRTLHLFVDVRGQ